MRAYRLTVLLIAVLGIPCAVHAQPRWTIQFHAGASVTSDGGSGTATLPPPSAPVTRLPVPSPTRPVPSWFFGDGITLMNQVNAQVRPNQTVTGIDSLLTDSRLSSGLRPALGVRITRTLTPRFSIEGAVALQTGGDTLDDNVRGIVDAAMASFRNFWQPLPGFAGAATSVVDTNAEYDDEGGRQLTSTAALRVHIAGAKGRSLYAIGGGGMRSTYGHRAEIRLEGTYNVGLSTIAQFAERDNVTVSFDVDRHVPVGLVGVGWQQPLSPRAGFSIEVRSHLGRSSVSTTVTTAPDRNINGNTVVVVGLTPAIFLSNIGIVDSSLTTELERFRTFKATGVRTQTSMTAGVFFRF